MAQVRVLGGVSAVAADSAELDLGPPKCRLVLAALALNHGEPVPVPRLVDLVWGEEPPSTAPKILQGYVSRLRKALGAKAIATVGAAYRLERAVEVDATRFGRLVAVGDVEEALDLWAGPPLAGLDPVGLQPAVDGLRERWLDATEQRLQQLAEDDPGAAVGPLTELTEDHPFREGTWAALMLALARTDRQADALAAFQRARTHLVDELGIEPGERLRELEARILAGDVVSAAASPSLGSVPDHDHRRSGPPVLPAVPDLVGRDEDIELLLGAMRTASLVTLLGPGGIGKTSLAITVARAWREREGGRVVFVELDEVTDAAEVVGVVAETLGVAEPPDGDLLTAVVAVVAAQSTLLVLDNCEHVLPGAAALVGAFGPGRSTTRLLATSRERLGAVREHLHPVDPLDPAAEGAELFVRRAHAVAPGLDLGPDRAVVEELCRQLDGVPLAIELAAARTRSLTPAQLLERLGDRFRLLVGRGEGRQATLARTVAWSYDLLDRDEQLLFARLSVFTGPFDLLAAEAVAAGDGLDPIDVDRLLGDLVERSMVAPVDGLAGRRFRLLETLRQFAAARLDDAGAAPVVEARHAAWVRRETARIGELLAGPGEIEGVQRLDALWPNLRAAVDRAVSDGDADLAGDLVAPVVTEASMRRRGEIGTWAERILAASPQDPDDLLFWLSWALHRHMQSGNQPAFEALVERYGHAEHPLVRACRWYLHEDGAALLEAGTDAVAWLRARGHEHAADLMEMTTIGSGLMTTARFDEAIPRFETWIERYAAAGPPTLHYFSLGFLGYTLQLCGDVESARAAFLAAADVEVPSGTYAASRPAEVEALFVRGDHERARRLLLEHVDDVLAMGTVDVARLVAVAFVNLMVGLGRPRDAAPALAYLDAVGEFGAMARATLVAEAAAVIGPVEQSDGDGTAALLHMRRCLLA